MATMENNLIERRRQSNLNTSGLNNASTSQALLDRLADTENKLLLLFKVVNYIRK